MPYPHDHCECHKCGRKFLWENFTDQTSCVCGQTWCSSDCAEEEGWNSTTRTCAFCRRENVEDAELLAYILREINMTREEAVQEMLEQEEKITS